MKPEIIATSGNLPICSIEGCGAYATAFLQEASESAGRKIVKKSTPYCATHAREMHEQIIKGEFIRSGQNPTYQPESFDHPHKLNEKSKDRAAE